MTTSTLSYKPGNAFEELRHLHFLLVEDNTLNAKLVSVLFAQEGIGLTLAKNGQEAIEKIKMATYDLVLMDMEMPVMNGYQATNIIRQELNNNIPIIAMTANQHAGEMKKCLQLGMNEYMVKPIDAAVLFETIHNLLYRHQPVPAKPVNAKLPVYRLNTEKVCNMGYLTGATRGNKKMIHNILTVFFKETGKELIYLKDAIANKNYAVISEISHKIKSAFAILGISVLEPVFKEMEYLSSHTSGIIKIALLNRRVNIVFKKAKSELKADY
ncbi:MAG: response regulator [Ferruginibacter sp.]